MRQYFASRCELNTSSCTTLFLSPVVVLVELTMQHIPIIEMCSNSVTYYSELCVIYFQELIHSSIAQTSYHNLLIYKCFIVLSNSFFIRIFSGFYVGSMCLTSHIQKALSRAQSLLSNNLVVLEVDTVHPPLPQSSFPFPHWHIL